MCLDPRDLICHVCGKKYHVDNYDPDSPSAYSCLECYKRELEEQPTEFCEQTEPRGPFNVNNEYI